MLSKARCVTLHTLFPIYGTPKVLLLRTPHEYLNKSAEKGENL